jgi:hypothetical protein
MNVCHLIPNLATVIQTRVASRKQRKDKPYLHPELWSLVFRFCTNIPGLLVTSPLHPLSDEPRSWIHASLSPGDTRKAKASLVSVCRLWRILALPYFYEYIRIRRTYDLGSLQKILAGSTVGSEFPGEPNHIGRYVKRIDLQIYSEGRFIWTVEDMTTVVAIVQLCHNLTIFRDDTIQQRVGRVATPDEVISSLLGLEDFSSPRSIYVRHLQWCVGSILPSSLSI